MADTASLETRDDAVKSGGEAKYWQGQLELAEQDHRDWIKEGRSVVQRYKGEKTNSAKSGTKRFNILFSNTETLKAALFARMAKPDVRRRFADRDVIGRQVAEIIERASIYSNDCGDADREYERALEDYLLPGRAVVRVQYTSKTAVGDDGKEYVSDQDLYDEHVLWDDFRHEPARKWDKVNWIAFRHLMNRSALKKNFGDVHGKAAPLNWTPKADDDKVPDAFKRAEVWEIWDKEAKKRHWVINGYKDILRTDDDPYGLENFYPIAEPLQAVSANDTFIPKPEFTTYQDQADGLDEIEARIDRLTRALKRRGVYDATFKELGRLAKANDNEFIAVKNYADLSTKGGLSAAFQSEDLQVIAVVLRELHTQRDLRVQTIYEVVGIADIMRGSSNPNETLGAQKIKAQFGGNRLKKRQDKVQKWIRDTLRIKAEIIAEHFEPQKMAEMTGLSVGEPQVDPMTGQPGPSDGLVTAQMVQILRSDKLRSYRVDVETDSTVFEDAEAEKQGRVELLKSVSEFVTAWMPVLQMQPTLLTLAFELLAFGVRGFKAGRSLEDSIDQAKLQLEQSAKQAAQQGPPPDPKVEAEKIKAAAVQQKAQIDGQVAQQKAQSEAAKSQMEMQALAQKHQMELERLSADLQAQREEMAMMRERMGMEMAAAQRQAMMDDRASDMEMMRREREHEMGLEASQVEHETGLEMMAEKARQAKRPKNVP